MADADTIHAAAEATMRAVAIALAGAVDHIPDHGGGEVGDHPMPLCCFHHVTHHKLESTIFQLAGKR